MQRGEEMRQSLRVIVSEGVMAVSGEGVDLDYVAQGQSFEEMKGYFVLGLYHTLRLNLLEKGSVKELVDQLQKAVPQGTRERISQEIGHFTIRRIELDKEVKDPLWEEVAEDFPFNAIEFYIPKKTSIKTPPT